MRDCERMRVCTRADADGNKKIDTLEWTEFTVKYGPIEECFLKARERSRGLHGMSEFSPPPVAQAACVCVINKVDLPPVEAQVGYTIEAAQAAHPATGAPNAPAEDDKGAPAQTAEAAEVKAVPAQEVAAVAPAARSVRWEVNLAPWFMHLSVNNGRAEVETWLSSRLRRIQELEAQNQPLPTDGWGMAARR
jgi:hypothetical protein